MSKDKYVEKTLTMPSELPLFNYNINFEGLRHILEDVNLKANHNEQLIKKLQQQMNIKLPTVTHQQSQKKLNSSYLFGVKCQQYIDKKEEKTFEVHKIKVQDLPEIDQFCWKMNRMAEIVEYLKDKSQEHDHRLNNDNKRHQKLIDQSFRRLEDKLQSGMDSFSKTINSYFTQTNAKVSELQSHLNTHSKTTQSKFEDVNSAMGKKVSEGHLKTALETTSQKMKKELESMLKNDHMQRLTTVNQLKQHFKEAEKDIELKNKAVANKMQELSEKVAKAMQINSFQMEKHKIFERISEIKHKTDDMVRKNNEFVEFRKSYLTNNEKIKQDIIGLGDEINKIQNKEGSFKKLQNMSDVLNSLNPHLICELGEEVKLHQKEIGKLQKMIQSLQNELKEKENQKPMPAVSGAQNSDLVQKIIKEFMNNMDFEARVKRGQKDIQQLKKKNDAFNELEKKIYTLSKQVDMGAITKELRKKCDEENTRKDTRILDGKIEQLFQFYKQLRRDVDQKKKIQKNQSFDNASLTTKRLVSANCLSCNPSTPSTRRQYAKNRLQMSLDYSVEGQKNTIYSRLGK